MSGLITTGGQHQSAENRCDDAGWAPPAGASLHLRAVGWTTPDSAVAASDDRTARCPALRLYRTISCATTWSALGCGLTPYGVSTDRGGRGRIRASSASHGSGFICELKELCYGFIFLIET
ncbi:hypothetical protein ACFSL6_27195 [Paenibacillus thailandensis]|uniref:hypothetical protein n=1 Tax=Paenibacillus thailandensis TaxID=393250 RepID=UPI00363D87A7